MKLQRSLFLAALALLPLGCATAGTRMAPPVAADAMKVTTYTLPNGLTVMLSENHEEPRFDAWITARTGSHKDPQETTGLAHYLEHMLFKGSTLLGTKDWEAEKPHLDAITGLYDQLFVTSDPDQRAELYQQIDEHNQQASQNEVANEFDQIYDRWGGRGLNAFTSTDQTSYVVNLPANRLESWAALESQRFVNPVFRLFQTEIEAVYEEKNRGMDNKERVLQEAFMSAMYPEHTYGTQTTLGHVEHLKNPKISAMYDYFHKWYVPGNMVISLAGDFDTTEAIGVIERTFGKWEPKPVPADPQFPLPKPHGAKRVETTFEAEDALMIGFLTVPDTHPDRDALVLCDMMLDNSQTGLINRNISQKQLALSAGASPMMWTYAGCETLRGVPLPGQTLEQLESLLLEQVQKLKDGEFSQDDLDAVITDFEINRKQALEDNRSRVQEMTGAYIGKEDWAHHVHELDRMRKIDRAQVVATAKRYFGDDYVVVYRRKGPNEVVKIPKPPFTPVEIDGSVHSQYFEQLAAMPAKPLEPHFVEKGRDYQVRDMKSGKLYHVHNPVNDLFSVSFNFPVGTDHDPRIGVAFGLIGLGGAGEYDPVDFRRRLYALGSTVSGGAGAQESVISVTGLDANLEETLELMRTHFMHPTGVGDDELHALVARTIGGRAHQKINAQAVNGALISYALRGKESSFLKAPDNATLQSYHAADTLATVADLWKTRRKVSYVGTRSPEDVARLLDAAETNTDLVDGPEYKPEKYVVPGKNRVLVVNKETNQSLVTLLGPDGTFDPEQVPESLAYNEFMSGSMGSVVFQEVRESRALAYAVGTNYRTPSHAGEENLFTGQLGTQVDKTVEAIDVLLGLVRDMPVQPERLEQVRKSKDEQYRGQRIGFRQIAGVVQTWEDQGLDGDPRRYNWQTILNMSFDDLRAFAARFADMPMTITIVGDTSRMDKAKLAAFGEIVEVDPDSLFNW